MKVLIISHNAISTTNNMGKTIKSLFSVFEKDEICQLYIHPFSPDVDVCSSYYRITDKEILQSLYKFTVPGGVLDKKEISKSKETVLKQQKVSVYAKGNNSKPLKRLLRDAMWGMSRWDNYKLEQWLDEEKPTCIFLAPGYAKFIYDIALYIGEKRHIPIVTYICDDYYFVKEPKTRLGRIQLKLLQRKTDKLFENAVHLIAINDEISDNYHQKFNVNTSVIMTGTDLKGLYEKKLFDEPKIIAYFGNIRCNRNVSLAEVGKALDIINQKYKTAYTLKIYTNETENRYLKAFDEIKSIKLTGFVSGEKFIKAFMKADWLLHVEAFDKESIDLVKCSVSTKIADSLASGRPLIAYGPDCVASIKYLIKNDCAVVISDKALLLEKLNETLFDYQESTEKVKAALALAERNHDNYKNSSILKELLSKL